MKSKSQHYVGYTIRDHVQKVVEHLQDHKSSITNKTKRKFQILAKALYHETKLKRITNMSDSVDMQTQYTKQAK